METWLLISSLVLWVVVLFLGFLLLGALRALGLVSWRLEQLEATTPKRLGRDGLKPGKKAPDFSLPSSAGGEVALHNFAGRKVLLVFTQSGCAPCKKIVPELNRLGSSDDSQVLVINNGDPEATRKWAEEVGACFPVLAQDRFSISKRYEVFATPFAFLIDQKGLIASKGIINNREHIHYVLSGTSPSSSTQGEPGEVNGQVEPDMNGAARGDSEGSYSHST